MAVKIAGGVSGNLAEVTALGELKIAGTFSATTTTLYAANVGSAVPTQAAWMGGDVSGVLQGVKLTAGRLLMVDASGTTVPISAVSLPLPLGASTETTLAAMSAKLPASLGSKTSANSLSIVLASDQTGIPVTKSGTWNVDSVVTLGSITATVAVGQATATNLKAEVIGNKTNNNAAPDATFLAALTGVANAAAPTWTEGRVVALSTDLSGSLRVVGSGGTISPVAPSLTTSTVTSVGASATNVTLHAANTTRRHLAIFNNGSTNLYLKLGATASTSSFTLIVIPGGFYELPNTNGIYTGIVDGIWAGSPTGAALVTEVTP
jgi:hypothetical protein